MTNAVWEEDPPEEGPADIAPSNWIGPWIERARLARGEWVVVDPENRDGLYAKLFTRKGAAHSYKSVINNNKIAAMRESTRDRFDCVIGEVPGGWILRIRLNNKKGA